MMQTGYMNATERQDKEKGMILLLWLAIIAMIILFGGFSSAIIVRQADKNWFQFDVPFSFTISTIVILVSSITMTLGSYFTRRGMRWPATIMILITLGLGIAFAQLQFQGWKELLRNNIYFLDNKTGNISGSFFYVITALHLTHLAGGLIALLVTLVKSAMGKYKPDSYLGVKLCATYWHFLGGLWLYLFLFWNFSDKIL
jgi:cytochrome c oxidase subunit 3